MKYDIAVVIATKKRPCLLAERAIQSVMSQIHTPSFVVVVDDSDPEYVNENQKVVTDLKRASCTAVYLQNQRSKGASGAWNTAVDWIVQHTEIIENTFIAVLDDDDEWMPDYLSSCLNSVQKYHADWVACDFVRIESLAMAPIIQQAPDKVVSDLFLIGNPGIQGSNLFLSLTAFLQSGGFDEALLSCTDRDLCIRLCDLGSVTYIRNPSIQMQHYAEVSRLRLSTPHTENKQDGLSAFWQKYHGRMNSSQLESYCERAKILFDWSPPCELCKQEDPSSIQKEIEMTSVDSQSDNKRIGLARAELTKITHNNKLVLLGFGLEGVVFTDQQVVYKVIDDLNVRRNPDSLGFLKSQVNKWHGLSGLYNIESFIVQNGLAILSYKYESSRPYQGGFEDEFVSLLISCSRAGIVCNNMHPQNILITDDGLKFIDYGYDIKPWSELGFEHMVRRAYLCILYAGNPNLRDWMHASLTSLDLDVLKDYPRFRCRLNGFDFDINKESEASTVYNFNDSSLNPINLYIGVITGDACKIKRLISSLAILEKATYLNRVEVHILCNGSSGLDIQSAIQICHTPKCKIIVIDENKQINDAKDGTFGIDYSHRPTGVLGIAQARTMIQKYVGLAVLSDPTGVSWILDDDMRIDSRAINYLSWLPTFKTKGVDILIGSYEGSSPNPPLNGLRVLLVDLLHNLQWLQRLPSSSILPDRKIENKRQRETYPDYYYDLSRKHTAHLEYPQWLEPEYSGETVREAYARLTYFAPFIVTGYPLTRSIRTIQIQGSPLDASILSVNRGGNTFIFNTIALLQTPNLIPKIKDREARRSDMMWALINKQYRKLNIRAVSFPVLHDGRVVPEKSLNLAKVIDEIIGSSLYAALGFFTNKYPSHDLVFSTSDLKEVWTLTTVFREERLSKLQQSFYRIEGLTKALSKVAADKELGGLLDYLNRSFSKNTYDHIQNGVRCFDQVAANDFFSSMRRISDNYAIGNVATSLSSI